MTAWTGPGDSSVLSSDEAFDVLGNETRLRILQTLGEAGGPLSFTELRDRVGIPQGGEFNYHLDRLVGHFVEKTGDGYELRQAGRSVVRAVLSGSMTSAPVLERTRIDRPCRYCGAPIEVRYRQGRVETFCTECAGTEDGAERGYLGGLRLPPAGLQGRTAEEVFRTAWTWTNLRTLAIASGICPDCSAPLDRRVSACEDHDASDGLCDRCNRRYAVQFHYRCTNCVLDGERDLSSCLAATTDLLAFLTAHDVNPVSPARVSEVDRVNGGCDEDVRSTDPIEAEFTFTVDGDTLTLTVDDPNVFEGTKRRATRIV